MAQSGAATANANSTTSGRPVPGATAPARNANPVVAPPVASGSAVSPPTPGTPVPPSPAAPAAAGPVVSPQPDATLAGPTTGEPSAGVDAVPVVSLPAALPLAFPLAPRPAGFFAVARESIFGPADNPPWQPLPLRTFFTEGWRDPWIAPPNGDGGAPRQGWIGAADGNFYRLYWYSYIEAFHTTVAHNGYTARYNLYTPLSRRLLLITTIPAINANTPSFNLGTADFGSSGAAIQGQRPKGTGTSFGDLTFTPRLMLAESRNFSLTAQLTIQIPTGKTDSGAGKAILSPGLQFWSDLGRGWVLRGAFNEGTGTNNPAKGETLVSQLAIGQTITPHTTPIFGDFTYYLAMNASNQITPKSLTTVTLGPGFRTHLGRDYYLLSALTIPVTGPHPFDESLTIWFMKTF